NDRPASRDFVTHELRRDVVGNARSERFALVLESQARPVTLGRPVGLLAAQVLPDGDEFHFRCDDALARIVQLGDSLAVRRLSRLAFQPWKGFVTDASLGLGRVLEAQITVVLGPDFPALVP